MHKTLDKDTQRAVCHITADVEAACIEHGVRGHLSHEHIAKMIAEYTPDEREARMYGRFAHLVGLRFKQFSRNIHVIRPFVVDPRNYTVYQALDPHSRTNDAVMWMAVDEKGRKFIVDELWIKCQGGTSELAALIKNKDSQYRVERRICDPSAFTVDQHTMDSLAKRLQEFGLNYQPATKLRQLADQSIEDALSYQTVAGSNEFITAPELFIFNNCHQTIYEFEHLCWDDWRGKASELKDPKEKAVDKADHFIEDTGRLLLLHPKHYPPVYGNLVKSDAPDYDPFAR